MDPRRGPVSAPIARTIERSTRPAAAPSADCAPGPGRAPDTPRTFQTDPLRLHLDQIRPVHYKVPPLEGPGVTE